MNQNTRYELLTVLAALSDACPEMRFGQLIANLSTLAKGLSAEGLWDAEDEELLAAARQQLDYFLERRSFAGEPAVAVGQSCVGDPLATE